MFKKIHLSNAFDTLNHNLLIEKLEAYGLDSEIKPLVYLQSHSTKRYERIRIDVSYSNWESIIAGVPQDSILGLLLFMKDILLYMEKSDLCNYADDGTFYTA